MVPVDSNEATVVSDEEELKDVPMAAAEKIALGLNSLTETMSKLHSQAEELVQEEQKAKRPRTADSAPSTAAVGPVVPLLESSQPFVQPGGQ